jgi:hypothetical protein
MCRSCGSGNRLKLRAEIAVHFPGLEGLNKPIVWVFPELLVCLDCGIVEFVMRERQLAELRLLAKGDAR